MAKKLKVLWFVNTPSLAAPKYGVKAMPSGSWISAAELEMRQRNDVDLAVTFLMPGEKTHKFTFENRAYYVIHQKNPFLRIRGYLNRITHSIRLCKMDDLLWAIDDFKPDIIHIYGSEEPFGLLSGKTDIPIVLRIQGILQIHRRVLERNISHLHTFSSTKISSLVFGYGIFHYLLLFRRKAIREEKIFQLVKYYIGQTDWDESLIRIFSPGSKYFRLKPVVRKEFFLHEWQKPRKNNSSLAILSVISSNLYKGFEEIIEVAKILKKSGVKFSWKIAGTVKDEPNVKIFEGLKNGTFAKNNIQFLGILDEKKLIEQHLKSDIYVHPSHIENECLSIIEAMILGVPIISNFVGGISTYLENNKTGLMVQDNDPLAMSGAILSLRNDPQKAKALGKKARQEALKTFDTPSSSDELIGIYQEILRQQK